MTSIADKTIVYCCLEHGHVSQTQHCKNHGHYFDQLYPKNLYRCKCGIQHMPASVNGAVTTQCLNCGAGYQEQVYMGRVCSWCGYLQPVGMQMNAFQTEDEALAWFNLMPGFKRRWCCVYIQRGGDVLRYEISRDRMYGNWVTVLVGGVE